MLARTMVDDTQARRAAIARLIRSRQVGTQEELRELVARQGFEVTQATLSRDLARMGARRVSRPEGGTAYELPQTAADPLREIRDLTLDVLENGHLLVIRTTPGAAQAVGRGIDLANVPGCLGTIAGDDTVFLAPARSVSAAKLAKKLKTLLGRPA